MTIGLVLVVLLLIYMAGWFILFKLFTKNADRIMNDFDENPRIRRHRQR